MSIIQSIVLGIIEGLTEFLPVSSTGHLILASAAMKIQETEFNKTFEIVIQLGAIMAVVIAYFRRFFQSLTLYIKLAIAFIPTGILGFLLYKTIKHYLFNPISVSVMLILGGIILIIMDKWTEKQKSVYPDLQDISYPDAVKIGLFQCISMIPGVSRAAATIFGGLFSGFNRQQAAEFSFLLAVPTMLAASGYDLLKTKAAIHGEEITILLIGAIVAFIFALIAIKAFIAFITRFGFKLFGWYRIAIGILFLVCWFYLGSEMMG